MLGEIFHDLARQKECRIIEGHLLADHVHMCLEIAPKHAGASVTWLLERQECTGQRAPSPREGPDFGGEHFWARGYAVSTVGFELGSVKKYIREQEQADKEGRSNAPFEGGSLSKPPACGRYSDLTPAFQMARFWPRLAVNGDRTGPGPAKSASFLLLGISGVK
jgi:putative transposase